MRYNKSGGIKFMRKTMEKMKEKKAITLIALVVTIAVILILAGITVGMVTSDNGVLKETKNAKTLAEIDNEKSIVERAKMLTMMRSKNGSITYEVFEPALKEEAGKMPTEVSDAIGTIEVLFTNSNRYYEIDEDGNVSEPQEVVKEKYAGDITKGGFWIDGRYDMGDDIKKTCHQSFFAYEKDGMLYEFEPSRVWEMSQKTIAEYALNHGADRVYCYQALTVWRLADYNVQVGYEAAIQHSPLRIPYDDFVVKEDSRNGGYAITEIVTLNNQMSLLDYGTVRTQSNSVWEKIGGIAHFVGEEGEE